MKQELKNKMLNDEQVEAVRFMITASLREMYTSAGSIPDSSFERQAEKLVNGIIKDVQKSLIQTAVFKKAVDSIKPIKKATKKVTKKNGK